MKRIITILATICFVHNIYAQNPNANGNAQWRINGNSAATSDFIGTTNNQPLILKTNNIQRAIFDTQGKTIFDGGGEVVIHPGGLHRPILSSPIAAYMLKVGGSGHFDGELNSRQLFVEEYITYKKSLKGPRIDVDTIRMDSTRGIFGHTKIFGDVQIKQNLEVSGDAVFKQSLLAQTIVVGDILNNAEITLQTTASGAKIINFGLSGPISPLPTTCIKPYAGVMSNFNSRAIITNGNAANSNVFDFNNDGSNGFIDYGYDISLHPKLPDDGIPSTPIPALKLNSVCWGDVEIAKGGGVASTGPNFEVGNPVRNRSITSNIFSNKRVGQRITVTSAFPETYPTPPVTYNSQFFVNRSFIKALSVFNTVTNANGDETFVVFGDGRVGIGDSYVPTGYQLAVKGKILAEEVVVQLRTAWPDYVFNKDYKLKSLSEVESYISKNKHLENIPSSQEIEINGVTLGNVVSKQMEKIEELTLYLIEQQKQIEELKKQVESLKR
ncbi:MAG: hypothetical protein V4565_14670 [Bacteroidota bacterium]